MPIPMNHTTERVQVPALPAPSLLPVFEYKGKLVADSRDVAAMIGRPHWIILRTIRTMSKHLSDNRFVVADYFSEETYIDEQGKSCLRQSQRPCGIRPVLKGAIP